MSADLRIRDLIDVRPHPTVVRLEKLDAERSRWIRESFCVTEDVSHHLESLKAAFSRSRGCGAFLIGQYGSGKSHFLAYLAQSLSLGELPGPDPLALSMVNFPASLSLEEVVSRAVGLPESGPSREDRRVGWTEVVARHPRGLCLLIDELSEFLRSKADPSALAEDIRFLQFLGEFATSSRLFVVAAAQEQIEHIGRLDDAQYRKIKDRYPLRLLLSTDHVKDIVARSILVKKPGFSEAVEKLASRLREALGEKALDFASLVELYPIHPTTIDMLERVRDSFSQARGVVDFVVGRLAGDRVRGIEPFLDRPFGSFVTPDAIVEHFRDVFELQSEFQPLAPLFDYYGKAIPRLFSEPERQALGRRMVNLLALNHFVPGREGLTAVDAANALLLAPSRLEPSRNAAIAEALLKTLCEQGRFVREARGRFGLELKDDGAASLERLLEREMDEVKAQGEAALETIVPHWGDEGWNPFLLPRDRWQSRSFKWHLHDRPYSVYLGSADPPPQEGVTLAVRLPWGRREAIPAHPTVIPEALSPTPDVLELAALLRLRKRPLGRDVLRRIDERLPKRFALFANMVQAAYSRASIASPDGSIESASAPLDSLGRWLDGHAEKLYRKAFPSFVTFAPSHGPLPKEAYRAFIAFGLENDLCREDAPESVALVREGYLVPMGLVARKGREYVIPTHPERHELCKLVSSLLLHEPAPKVLYDHLAGPVYGLVPDQVHVLLIFLFLQGELDIVKGSRSLRDLYETLPNPINYDRIVPGKGLSTEELHALGELCEGLGVKLPRQWSVLGERRVAAALKDLLRRHELSLQSLFVKLKEAPGAAELCRRIESALGPMAALQAAESEMAGVRQLLYEAGSGRLFAERLRELLGLPERIERLLAERGRLEHLLTHPGLASSSDEAVGEARQGLHSPPGLDDTEGLEAWIARARSFYESYKGRYLARHEAYWQGRAEEEPLGWAAPAVGASRHLVLGETLASLADSRSRIQTLRCQRRPTLEFQPVCACGFDGARAPIEAEVERFQALRRRIETEIDLFFGQQGVRARMRQWVDQGLPTHPRTLAYIEGKASTPEVSDIDLLDRHLSGVELVQTLDAAPVLDLLAERTWDRPSLVKAVEGLLERLGPARIRFARPEGSGPTDDVVSFCTEQCLRHGLPLPQGLPAERVAALARRTPSAWLGQATLEKLDDLRFPEELSDRVLVLFLDGAGQEASSLAPPLLAAREILRPTAVSQPMELALLASRLYRQHQRLRRVAGERWLGRLDRLAFTELPMAPPSIVEVLRSHAADQWLVVDALGIVLYPAISPRLPELLPDHRVAEESFALVSALTTTDSFYRELAEAGLQHSIVKVDALDRLLHDRHPDLEDLERVALAEIGVALKALRRRIEGRRPVLLFADHGFRIAADGSRFHHGGPSTLERIVPVVRLVPANR